MRVGTGGDVETAFGAMYAWERLTFASSIKLILNDTYLRLLVVLRLYDSAPDLNKPYIKRPDTRTWCCTRDCGGNQMLTHIYITSVTHIGSLTFTGHVYEVGPRHLSPTS
jgi:hypothetical protein